jgi:hypothetical protein
MFDSQKSQNMCIYNYKRTCLGIDGWPQDESAAVQRYRQLNIMYVAEWISFVFALCVAAALSYLMWLTCYGSDARGESHS